MNEEILNARTFAISLVQDTGLGGTAIDIDDMANQPPARNADYSGRPWENDAFFSEEVEGRYWDHIDGADLDLPVPDVCCPKFDGNSRAEERLARIRNDGQSNNGAK